MKREIERVERDGKETEREREREKESEGERGRERERESGERKEGIEMKREIERRRTSGYQQRQISPWTDSISEYMYVPLLFYLLSLNGPYHNSDAPR